MAIIGGDIAAMEAAAGRFDSTGAGTATEATSAASFARSQHGEYDALAGALVARIRQTVDVCTAEADAMRATLEGTEWFGASRATVEAAEAELRSTLRTLLEDTGATAEQFKTDLSRLVMSYDEQVLSGRLTPAMERLRSSYNQAAHATRRVAEGFRQADAAIGGF